MKLPKYEFFTVPAIINVVLGAFVINILISKEMGWFIAIFAMVIFQLAFINIYEYVRRKLNEKE